MRPEVSVLEWKRLTFDQGQREAFKAGALAPAWAAKYPQLFDAADLQMTKTQPSYHFYEWLAAISIFDETGYLSLVEKYQFKKHGSQHSLFKEVVPPGVYQLVVESPYFKPAQAPDLFVFNRDHSDWFFCEVKGPGDDIAGKQGVFFATIERASGKPVRILRFALAPTGLPRAPMPPELPDECARADAAG